MLLRALGLAAISGLTIAIVTACGEVGTPQTSSLTPSMSNASAANVKKSPCAGPLSWEAHYKHHVVFAFKGKVQTWTSPAGLSQAFIIANGAHGGAQAFGGAGGCIATTLAVTAKTTYDVYVGGMGGAHVKGKQNCALWMIGGFNGGGTGGNGKASQSCGWGGSGASDVRSASGTYSDRMIVAGGGGGGGATYVVGGKGGYPSGQSGGNSCFTISGNQYCADGGGGGTSSSGGAGGAGTASILDCSAGDGTAGGEGPGGSGGSSGCYGGGGGGGGYYGGGGGGAGPYGGGGGGGGSCAVLSQYYGTIYSGTSGSGSLDGTVYVMWSPKK